ncbi:unnamed protein product [Sphenostylis stenocarpa]|uniref:Uncharacterized protein n=1 Tax=Sphenostylis stenocarpa TaxID=92480 RepID=A0AA86VMP8_9FABA|nr:unnamed protein product [Sphenostylis stenocarpa]
MKPLSVAAKPLLVFPCVARGPTSFSRFVCSSKGVPTTVGTLTRGATNTHAVDRTVVTFFGDMALLSNNRQSALCTLKDSTMVYRTEISGPKYICEGHVWQKRENNFEEGGKVRRVLVVHSRYDEGKGHVSLFMWKVESEGS